MRCDIRSTGYKIIAIVVSALFIINWVWIDFFVSSWFNLLFSLGVMAFSLVCFRKRLGLFFFTLSLVLFLIARPIIDILMGFSQYKPMHYTTSSALIANRMIGVSLLAILIGQLIYENWFERLEKEATRFYPDDRKRRVIHVLVLVVGVFSFLSLGLTIHEKLIFRINNNYPALYSDFQSSLPFLVRGFAAITVPVLILIVLTSCKKRVAYGAILIYIGLNVYLMLTGVRADFTKAFIFLVFVLLQRELLPRISRRHVGRLIVVSFVIAILLIAVFFYVDESRLDYRRTNYFFMPAQLLYDQSISYMTLNRGQELAQMPLYQDKHYTFGPFSDYFGAARNIQHYTKEFVEKGDSLAADIAYHLYGENAFRGYGLGSSYIMELFHDFGYLGIAVYSVLLGALLASLAQISWKNLIIDTLKLRILLEIFYIPRAPATQFLVNLFVPQLLLPLIGSLLFAWLIGVLRNKQGYGLK